MKKTILFYSLLLLSAVTFSQKTTPSPTLTQQDYLAKSKSQKSTAWLLVGGGTAVLAGTLISAASSVCIGGGCTKKSFPIVPVGLGSAAIVGSIPFFITSSRNKKKAISLSLKNEAFPQVSKQNFVYKAVPSLTLKLNL